MVNTIDVIKVNPSISVQDLSELTSQPTLHEWTKLPQIQKAKPNFQGGISFQQFIGTAICQWQINIGPAQWLGVGPFFLIKVNYFDHIVSKLSLRERQVLQLIARGYAIIEIAQELNLSIRTVHTYRSRGMSKFNLRSNVELVHFCLQHGLIHQQNIWPKIDQ